MKTSFELFSKIIKFFCCALFLSTFQTTQCSKLDDLVINNPKIQREAYAAFKSGALEQFDALVGEQACQLRALIITELYKKYAEQIQTGSFEAPTETSEQNTLCLCYFLTKFKKKVGIDDPDRLEIEEILKYLSISKSKAKSIVQEAQEKLAKISVEAALMQISTLGTNQLAKNASPRRFGKQTLGCHISMIALCIHAYKTNTPIVIKVTRHCMATHEPMHFAYIPNTTQTLRFVPMPKTYYATNQHNAAIVLEGKSICSDLMCPGCWINKKFIREFTNKIRMLGLVSAIFANAAQHQQIFSDKDKDCDFTSEDRFDASFFKCKQLAKQGFSRENPSCFLLQHVYGQTLEKALTQRKEIVSHPSSSAAPSPILPAKAMMALPRVSINSTIFA